VGKRVCPACGRFILSLFEKSDLYLENHYHYKRERALFKRKRDALNAKLKVAGKPEIK
jgi:hypothetical protein